MSICTPGDIGKSFKIFGIFSTAKTITKNLKCIAAATILSTQYNQYECDMYKIVYLEIN